jgi:hypothetical protein
MVSDNRRKKKNVTPFSMFLNDYIRQYARAGIPAMSKEAAVPGALAKWKSMNPCEQAP